MQLLLRKFRSLGGVRVKWHSTLTPTLGDVVTALGRSFPSLQVLSVKKRRKFSSWQPVPVVQIRQFQSQKEPGRTKIAGPNGHIRLETLMQGHYDSVSEGRLNTASPLYLRQRRRVHPTPYHSLRDRPLGRQCQKPTPLQATVDLNPEPQTLSR